MAPPTHLALDAPHRERTRSAPLAEAPGRRLGPQDVLAVQNLSDLVRLAARD